MERIMKFFKRPPDLVVGNPDDPYLRRWHLIPRNKWFNVYLHHIRLSDYSRDLHDHPWNNLTVVLKGTYHEWVRRGLSLPRRFGSIVFRKAEAAHRITILDWDAWTLFITGPRVREWGFHTRSGWVHNESYNDSWEASQ